jgi:hypothetical protein
MQPDSKQRIGNMFRGNEYAHIWVTVVNGVFYFVRAKRL